MTEREWEVFVTLAKAYGGSTVRGYSGKIEAIWLHGLTVRYDRGCRRPYFSHFARGERVKGPEWASGLVECVELLTEANRSY